MGPRFVRTALVMMLVTGGFLGARAGLASAEPASPAESGTPRRPPGGLETVAPPRGLPVEQERDPGHGPTPHEPVFLEPAATTTEHVRVRLSGWVAPPAPFERHENPGGPALGLTITWPPPAREAPSSGPSPWRGSVAR